MLRESLFSWSQAEWSRGFRFLWPLANITWQNLLLSDLFWGCFNCSTVYPGVGSYFLGGNQFRWSKQDPVIALQPVPDVRSYEPQFGAGGWSTSVYICLVIVIGGVFLTWFTVPWVVLMMLIGCDTVMYQSTWLLVTSIRTWSCKT